MGASSLTPCDKTVIKKRILKGQLWKSKRNDLVVEVLKFHKGHWQVRKLTEKPGVYNGTHGLHEYTMRHGFVLIDS